MAEIIDLKIILTVFLTGILPTLIWLLFWLKIDKRKPEPFGLLMLTFFAGALVVFLVLPLEQFIKSFHLGDSEQVAVFAGIEEIAKFLIVGVVALRTRFVDEPVDYAIYLITGALGFATAENVMFMIEPSVQQSISFIIETGTLRFLGASILHAMLASVVGIALGFVFYKRKRIRVLFGTIGLGIAIILHTFFNSFIIKYVQINGLLTLALLWLSTLIIIALLEKVRRVNH